MNLWRKKMTAPSAASLQLDPELRHLASMGESTYARVGDLQVDHSYQRPEDQAKINGWVANGFDPFAFGMLILSKRSDGSLFIVDGQNRNAMLRQMGWEDQLVPALVLTGLSVEQEARIFRVTNQERKALTQLSLFQARLVEGDPVAVDINAILTQAGLRITAGGSKTAFAAVKAAERVYTDSGPVVFRNAISILASSPHLASDRQAVSGDMLLAVAIVLVEYWGEIDLTRFVQQMNLETPAALVAKARAAKAATGGAMMFHLAAVLVHQYNKALRNNRLEELTRRPWRRNPLKVGA
jgi:hypothetical protein